MRVKFGRFVYSKRWRRIWSDNEVIAKFSFSHSRGEVVAVVNVTLDVTLNFRSSQFSVFLDANVFEIRQLCHMCELSWPFKIDGGCQVKISQGCKDSFSLPFARPRWRRKFVPTNHDDQLFNVFLGVVVDFCLTQNISKPKLRFLKLTCSFLFRFCGRMLSRCVTLRWISWTFL